MTWEYLTAELDDGFIELRQQLGEGHRQSLQGALTYLGSQGWELATSISGKATFGASPPVTLIFKRPKG